MLLLFFMFVSLYYYSSPIISLPDYNETQFSVADENIQLSDSSSVNKDRKIFLNHINKIIFQNDDNKVNGKVYNNNNIEYNITNFDNKEYYITIIKGNKMKEAVTENTNISNNNVVLNTSNYTVNTLIRTSSLKNAEINIDKNDYIEIVFPKFYNIELDGNYFKNKNNKNDGIILNNNIVNIITN